MPRPRKAQLSNNGYYRDDREMRDDHENFIDLQLENEKMMNVYSTEKVNDLIRRLNKGEQIDMGFSFHGDINYKNSNIRFEYTKEEYEELNKCADDIIYFVENYCHFQTDFGWIKVKLRKYQKEILLLMSEEYYDAKNDLVRPKNPKILLMQSRQTAKTTTTVCYIVWKMLFTHDKNIMLGSLNKDTCEEFMDKIKNVIMRLPFFMKMGITSMSKKMIVTDNRNRLICVPTTGSSGVSFTIHYLILDEFGVIPPAKARAYYTSIKPTLSSLKSGQCIILSTPRSSSHVFYDIYRRSLLAPTNDNREKELEKALKDTGEGWNGFVSKVIYYWLADPERATDEWKKEMIADIGERAFAQEYDLRFDAGGGLRLISPKDMSYMTRISKEFVPVPIYGVPNNVSQKILWDPDFHPDLLTEEDLVTRRFLLEVDTAGGEVIKINNTEDPDWNVINIYEIEFMSPARIRKNRLGYKEVKITDCIRFRQVGIYMDHEFNEEFSADAAKHIVFTIFKNGLGSFVGEIDNCRILLEVNFNGVNWIKKFVKHDLFYSQLIIKTFHSLNAVKKDFGYKTVSGARGKGYWCELGGRMIERRQIIVRQDSKESPQMSSVQQLGAFGKNARGLYKGEAMHDDIAVTVVFVPIALEQEDFQLWIEDWFRFLTSTQIVSWEKRQRLAIIGRILDLYVEQTYDDEYSVDDIKRLYGNAASGLGKISALKNNVPGVPIYAQPKQNQPGQFGGMGGGMMQPGMGNGFGMYSRGQRYQPQTPQWPNLKFPK